MLVCFLCIIYFIYLKNAELKQRNNRNILLKTVSAL